MPLIHSVIRAPAMCQFRTTRKSGSWALSLWSGPWWVSRFFSRARGPVCGCSWGKNNPNALLLSSFLSCVYMSVSLSVRAFPHPRLYFLLTVTFWWRVAWIPWVPSCGPSPAAELVQLGLLGSLRNLPVSERVQLAHFGQLRLHHGRLGLHREGDRPGSATTAPLLPPSPPAAPATGTGTWKLKIHTESLGAG